MDVMEMTRKTDLTTHMDMTCKVDNMTNLVDMTNRTDMTTRMDMTCRADVTSRMDVTCRPDMSFDALPSPGSNEDASPLMDMTCKNTRYFFFFFLKLEASFSILSVMIRAKDLPTEKYQRSGL